MLTVPISHSLRGLCGLKFRRYKEAGEHSQSQPARAVWIEITSTVYMVDRGPSQPARAVWIEIPLPSWA